MDITEVYRGFNVPDMSGLGINGLPLFVKYFNEGSMGWCTVGLIQKHKCWEGRGCGRCIMTCESPSDDLDAKCTAFAMYAASKGYKITRKGYEHITSSPNELEEVVVI